MFEKKIATCQTNKHKKKMYQQSNKNETKTRTPEK